MLIHLVYLLSIYLYFCVRFLFGERLLLRLFSEGEGYKKKTTTAIE